jgi:prefoldin subunit 5
MSLSPDVETLRSEINELQTRLGELANAENCHLSALNSNEFSPPCGRAQAEKNIINEFQQKMQPLLEQLDAKLMQLMELKPEFFAD